MARRKASSARVGEVQKPASSQQLDAGPGPRKGSALNPDLAADAGRKGRRNRQT